MRIHRNKPMPVSKSRPKAAVTAADVAQRAGVSIATVSRVLNRSVSVTEDVSARVRAAAAELGYVPHAAARQLAQGKTSTLGLLLPEIGAPFFSDMLRGVEMGATEAGYDLLIATQRPDDPRRPLWQPLGPHNSDGLLIFTDNVDAQEVGQFYRRRFPVVLLYRAPPADLPIPCVLVENRGGARRAVEHLIEAHGRRRIALLRGPEGNQDAEERAQGYRDALAAHGLPYDPALVASGEFQERPAREAVGRWLSGGLAFDAIFAGDDDSACGALQALQAAGRRVPQDVALAGFDDSLVGRYLTPPLTTVHAPTERVGLEAVRQLVQLIGSGQAAPTTLLPTELVIRQSCGCE
jgi:DNA-binding LacI/PurR family transcriptional regulator